MLLVTNMYPVAEDTSRGIFVARQIAAVNRLLVTPVEVLLVGRTGVGNLWRSRRAVEKALRRVHPDVVHVYYGLSGGALPLGNRTPLVLTLCGSDVLQWPVTRTPRGLLEYAVSVMTARRATVILAQSGPVRGALPTSKLRGRVWIRPTGVDLEHFRPLPRQESRRRLGWPIDEPVILFPANPRRPVKRYELAAAAVRRLGELGCPARLRALEGVVPDDVVLHLNASDVVVVTSLWEAGPIAITEALSCGVPVVSVPVGYAADATQRSRWLRVTSANPDALARALAEVLRQPPEHERATDVALPAAGDYAAALLDAYREAARGRGTKVGREAARQ